MEISKEDVQSMIVEAIKSDREQRTVTVAEKVTSRFDINSVSYNTARLFNDIHSEFRSQMNGVQESVNARDKSSWNGQRLLINDTFVHNKLRELVLMTFDAKSNADIPIEYRQKAIDLYKSLGDSWLELFGDYMDSRLWEED